MKPVAESTIAINAPIDLVWNAMLNVRQYPEWNPFVVLVETDAEVPGPGTKMLLHVKWADGRSTLSPESVTQVSPPTEVDGKRSALLAYRYEGLLSKLGMIRGVRFQWLDQAQGGPTVYRTREEFTGLLVKGVPLRDVQNGFERHAQALKVRAESLFSKVG